MSSSCLAALERSNPASKVAKTDADVGPDSKVNGQTSFFAFYMDCGFIAHDRFVGTKFLLIGPMY